MAEKYKTNHDSENKIKNSNLKKTCFIFEFVIVFSEFL